MNAWEPIAEPPPASPEVRAASFDLRRAAADGAPPPTPLVFASPHSGRFYPADMMAATGLDPQAIRRSEDALVDDLIAAAPDLGAGLIAARCARAYIDLNREAFELDAGMFSDDLPEFARARTARVAAGLGAIARVVAEGQEIYARKLTFAEARARIEWAHRPYHAALERMIAEAHRAHGFAILIDWHSMPAAAARGGGRDLPCDMVLGDRFGAACAGLLTSRVEHELEALGYRVARNTPTPAATPQSTMDGRRGAPTPCRSRSTAPLYLDETKLAPTAGFEKLKANLESLTRALAAADWSALRSS